MWLQHQLLHDASHPHDADSAAAAAALSEAPPPSSVVQLLSLISTTSVGQPCHSNRAECGLQQLLESWTDFFVLAGGDFLLLERSGFSFTAASVGLVPPMDRYLGAACAYCVPTGSSRWCANETYNHM